MTYVRTQDLLLVEDDDNDIELAVRALKSVNLYQRTHVVKDGRQALEYIFGIGDGKREDSGHYPLVVLLDLKLPVVDGLDVLTRLKSDAKTANIPIVILTSSEEFHDRKRCYELGVNSYIVKPYYVEEFSKAVSTAALYWLGINEPPWEEG